MGKTISFPVTVMLVAAVVNSAPAALDAIAPLQWLFDRNLSMDHCFAIVHHGVSKPAAVALALELLSGHPHR